MSAPLLCLSCVWAVDLGEEWSVFGGLRFGDMRAVLMWESRADLLNSPFTAMIYAKKDEDEARPKTRSMTKKDTPVKSRKKA